MAQHGPREKFYSFDEAASKIQKLGYTREEALKYVDNFDENKDKRISQNEFDKYWEVFKHFREWDKDRSNSITLDEAKAALRKPPFSYTSDKVEELLKLCDANQDGTLDMGEFIGFYAKLTSRMDELSRKFMELDTDKDNHLSAQEVEATIVGFLHCSKEKAREVIHLFDKNKDGRLDKNEFIAMWMHRFGDK